jgi:integrase
VGTSHTDMERTLKVELTEIRIRAAKPQEKPYKLTDGRGLHLLVTPGGSRLWRIRYRYNGNESTMGVGAYPDVTLKDARELVDDARKALRNGINPVAQRRAGRAAQADTFAAIAAEWLDTQRKSFEPATLEKAVWMLDRLINPFIGSKPVRQITAPDLLTVFRRLETRGKHETAHRCRQRCGQVFRYAIVTGRAERDPSADLRGALAPIVVTNRPAILEPAKVGALLRAIDGYSGLAVTECALKLAPLVFVRPGELRMAEWVEVDLDGSEWRIPAARMKMGKQHIVPLATQCVALLRELQPLTGRGRYVFPSPRTSTRPMSDAAITAALRRMGYTGKEMTWHGFRSIASTLLNEQQLGEPDWIEMQLAHDERNGVRKAYNHAKYLPQRRLMMQKWADYLETLKAAKFP